MNCVPGALPEPVEPELVDPELREVDIEVAAGAAAAPATVKVPCPRALAALAFGVLPWPQPPSRVNAIIAPAQRPELKPQQPVQNCQ